MKIGQIICVAIFASCTYALGWFMIFYGTHTYDESGAFFYLALIIAGRILWWPNEVVMWANHLLTGEKIIFDYTYIFINHILGYFSAAFVLLALRRRIKKRPQSGKQK